MAARQTSKRYVQKARSYVCVQQSNSRADGSDVKGSRGPRPAIGIQINQLRVFQLVLRFQCSADTWWVTLTKQHWVKRASTFLWVTLTKQS